MVPHFYTNASDNLAQHEADNLLGPRQEVTVDWYLDNMIDSPIWRWTSDEDALIGLDPWRFYMDLPIDPEELKERGWRLFVQRSMLPEGAIVGGVWCPKPSADEMTDAEQEDAAYWNYVSKVAP